MAKEASTHYSDCVCPRIHLFHDCAMSTVEDIFLKWVFPLLGGIVGTMMFMAPMKAVLNVRKERDLGVRVLAFRDEILSRECSSMKRLPPLAMNHVVAHQCMAGEIPWWQQETKTKPTSLFSL